MRLSSNNVSENGDWPWRVRRGEKMPAAGSTMKSALTTDAKSISHEHTYNEDTADPEQLESTLMRLSEMVGRRLREASFHARTIQLKLRYKDFTTITRAHTLPSPTQLDNEIFEQIADVVSQKLAQGGAGSAAGRSRIFLRGNRPGRRDLLEGRPPPALEAGPVGRRPPARQVRRVERVTGQRAERRLPRTNPREPGRPAG